MPKKQIQLLPPQTDIEVIAIHKKTKETFKKIVKLKDLPTMKKSKAYNYINYQVGYSQFNN